MSPGLVARIKRWRSRRGGVHRSGAVRQGIDANPELVDELAKARKRLADVDALAPAVEQHVTQAETWLRRNHLGPLFDQAFGAGK